MLALLVGAASAASAGQTVASRPTAPYDVRFMTNMIDHHAMAVQMAQVCQRRAVHGQLRGLCVTISASQQREIRQMRTWLRAWYRTDHAPMMMPGMGQQMRRLGQFSGRMFEIHFMNMMIPHHQEAVRDARTCVNRADHRELRQLCRNIIRTQTAEIRQMRGWLCAWYAQCGQENRQHRRGPGGPGGPGA
ncbi:MAG TPA: DUF305 domain-containing protein [Mycobacteriales bacterium]|nr:DUF305 domain-containing protein [Mycobacteriales bacterium]